MRITVTRHMSSDDEARHAIGVMARKLNRQYGWKMPRRSRGEGHWWHEAYIWRTADGTPIGFVAFRGAYYPVTLKNNHGADWLIDRAWFAPEYRRRGLLSSMWDEFCERYGEFKVLKPEEPMRLFLKRHNAEHRATK